MIMDNLNKLFEEDAACVCDKCGCSDVETVDDCVICKECGHKKELVTEHWNMVINALMTDEKETAINAASELIKNSMAKKIKLSEAFDKYKNSIRLRSDDVIVNGKKVATFADKDDGLVLNFPDGETEEFSSVKEMIAFLHDKFDLKESVVKVKETEVLNEGQIIDQMKRFGEFLLKWKKLAASGKKGKPKENIISGYQKVAKNASRMAQEKGDSRTGNAFKSFEDAFNDFVAGGMNVEKIDDLANAYSKTLDTKFMR